MNVGCTASTHLWEMLLQVEDVAVSNILHMYSKQYLECLCISGLCGFLCFRKLIPHREAAVCKVLLKRMQKGPQAESGTGWENSSPEQEQEQEQGPAALLQKGK